MTDQLPDPFAQTRRMPTVRIDTFKGRIAGTQILLGAVSTQLEDLHVLAYSRSAAAQAHVAGGAPNWGLDSHGDPAARLLWQQTALRVLDSAEDLSVTLQQVGSYFTPGHIHTRRDPTADATAPEIIEALAAQHRRRARGEYAPVPLIDQPPVSEPAAVTTELELLRAVVRKGVDRSRLTPAERDALARAIDPARPRRRRRTR